MLTIFDEVKYTYPLFDSFEVYPGVMPAAKVRGPIKQVAIGNKPTSSLT